MNVDVGTEIPVWEVDSVDPEKMKIMAALLADPNPIHFDVASVQALGMGDRVVNQGPLNMGYVMNMLTAWTGSAECIRDIRLRFRGNVLAGDHVRARGTVTAVRRESGVRLADCDVVLEVVGGPPALTGTATVVLPDSPVEPHP
jgi:acyl dehydratase